MATDVLQKGEGSSSSASQVLHLPSLSSQDQACSILTCAIQHLFLAKGQTPDPVSILQARRARERLAKSADGSMMMGSKRKSESFAKRQRTRKIDDLLLSFQRLSQCLLSAMQQLRKGHSDDEGIVDFVILIRFGQSRYSCRQQILISFQDVVSLDLRDPNAALQDASIRRKKTVLLEKKLVRFLLGLASEDDDFDRLLNSPLGLTRAHIFLLAPSTFTCQEWLRLHSLKMADTFFTIKDERRDATLEDALTPTPDPIPYQETQMAGIEVDVEAEDFDARRLKRMQQRALLRLDKMAESREKKRSQRAGILKSAKKQPPSASIILQCGRDDNEETTRVLPKNHCWYACKIALKSVA